VPVNICEKYSPDTLFMAWNTIDAPEGSLEQRGEDDGGGHDQDEVCPPAQNRLWAPHRRNERRPNPTFSPRTDSKPFGNQADA